MKKFVLSISFFATVGLLAACGSSDPGPGGGGNTGGDGSGGNGGGGDGGNVTTSSKGGFVTLSESGEGQSLFVIGSGSFFELEESTPISTDNPYENLEDACFFSEEPGDVTNPVDPGESGEVTSLSAGDALTVSAGGSTYATLTKMEQEGNISYTTDVTSPIQQPIPEEASVNIPGSDVFPNFGDRAFPSTPAFALTAPADPANAEITGDSSFAWTGSSEGSAVTLVFSSGAESFTCLARDDGDFSFPDDAKQELNNRDFTSIGLVAAGRTGLAAYEQEDATLFLSTSKLLIYANAAAANKVEPATLLKLIRP